MSENKDQPLMSVDTVDLGTDAELMADRSGFQRQFCQWLSEEQAIRGRVLDVGCGSKLPGALSSLEPLFGQLDGVDPVPDVSQHSLLTERWTGPFEPAPIPESAYDLAYAYNVLEHIATARPFFEKLEKILKPGGIFWGLTPHARHPFCGMVRLIERLNLKRIYARGREGINEYPAYYRLNSVRQVSRAIEGLGFESARFHYLPCAQWDRYFPRLVRFMPHLYDRFLGFRRGKCMLLLAMRLQKKQ